MTEPNPVSGVPVTSDGAEDFAMRWIEDIVNGVNRGIMGEDLYRVLSGTSRCEDISHRYPGGHDDIYIDDIVPDINDRTGKPYYAWYEHKVGCAKHGRDADGVVKAVESSPHYDEIGMDAVDVNRLKALDAKDEGNVLANTVFDFNTGDDGSFIAVPCGEGSRARIIMHDMDDCRQASFGFIPGDIPVGFWADYTDGVGPRRHVEVSRYRTHFDDAVTDKHSRVNRTSSWGTITRSTHWNLSTGRWSNPFICVDIDRDDALDVYRRATGNGSVPHASYLIHNRGNGHVQAFYIIPAVNRNNMSIMGYYSDVKGMLVNAMNGDRHETSGRCRNPYYLGFGVKDIEVLVPGGAVNKGVRVWTLGALTGFCERSGVLAGYREDKKRASNASWFGAQSCTGSPFDGKNTALSPKYCIGVVIPIGLRNATALRVANYYIWHEHITDEDNLCLLLSADLSFEQGEGDSYGSRQIGSLVRSALRNYRKRYEPLLDPRHPHYHAKLVRSGDWYVDRTGARVCTVDEYAVATGNGHKRTGGLASELGRRGGTRHSDAQVEARASNLEAGKTAMQYRSELNESLVADAMKMVEADDDLMYTVRSDGRRVRTTEKSAVWRVVNRHSDVMSRTTCYRHYDRIMELRESARELKGKLNTDVYGEENVPVTPSMVDGLDDRLGVVAVTTLADAVIGPLTERLVESGHHQTALDVLNATNETMRFMDTEWLRETGEDDGRGNAIERPLRNVALTYRNLFFYNGIMHMRDDFKDDAWGELDARFTIPLDGGRDGVSESWWLGPDGKWSGYEFDWKHDGELIDRWSDWLSTASTMMTDALRRLTICDVPGKGYVLHTPNRPRNAGKVLYELSGSEFDWPVHGENVRSISEYPCLIPWMACYAEPGAVDPDDIEYVPVGPPAITGVDDTGERGSIEAVMATVEASDDVDCSKTMNGVGTMNASVGHTGDGLDSEVVDMIENGVDGREWTEEEKENWRRHPEIAKVVATVSKTMPSQEELEERQRPRRNPQMMAHYQRIMQRVQRYRDSGGMDDYDGDDVHGDYNAVDGNHADVIDDEEW